MNSYDKGLWLHTKVQFKSESGIRRLVGVVTGFTDDDKIKVRVPGVRAESNWTCDPEELLVTTNAEWAAYKASLV
jgi:hypothetical protein|tara:strand:+ start:511 stop:735 length:225 start_codon:yes stop_codon:yes gene_type:complete